MSATELVTEFLLAAEEGNSDALKACLEKGVDINATNRQKRTAVTIAGNDSNLLIVFYVQIMPDDFVMQLHRF